MTAATVTEARRVIARARHDRPDGAGRCKAAVSRLVDPSMWNAKRDGSWVQVGGWLSWAYEGDCPDCGRPAVMYAKPVQGRHNPAKGCNPKCEGAVGPSCECSCAGLNHGGGWSA